LYPGENPIIVKAHDWLPAYKNHPVILCHRDPRDVAVSYWRSHSNVTNVKRHMRPAEIRKWATRVSNLHKSQYPIFSNAINHPRLLCLKYERFHNNYDWLFSQLETFFDYEFGRAIKEKIKIETSLKSNKAIADKFGRFKSYDRRTLIHGNHIWKGTHGSWKDFLRPQDREMMQKILASELKRWGYEN